jgi:ABC-type multidrug transport system fused ATPase/permease subunit
MERNIYKFIFKYSIRQQVALTVLSIASFVPYYYYLQMPKTIVNQGISGKKIEFPYDLLGTGIEVDQAAYLIILCFVFLALVLVQQGFKYAINVFQGVSGERMLRRLRYELYSRVLRFALPTFRRMSPGEIIPMITAEVEPLGGFIAEAFATPIFQGGMLLVTFIFLMVQNPVMGLAAVALYPLQFYLIPRMQRKVNLLAKERVRTQRRLADRIGESIAGIHEVHGHDGSAKLRAEFAQRLGQIYWIRFEIFQRKFVIKFLNNFLQQIGPFFFYSIGGYLTIKGQLDVGTVVAAVNAHKEMAAPWKELLAYYQRREDSRIKYEQVVAQFEPEGMREPATQTAEPEGEVRLSGELQVSNLAYNDEQGTSVLDGVSLNVRLPARVALVGGAGREELLLLIAHLLDPLRGRITIGGADVATLPESVTGRRIAYVGGAGYVFNTTIGDNLFYGLRHRPLVLPEYPPDRRRQVQREVNEALAAGNSPDDPAADWTEYRAAGVEDAAGLGAAAIRALRLVALDDDVYQLGLRGTLDPALSPELADKILRARAALRRRLADRDFAELVEGWDRGRYNSNATVAENLMFGTPVGELFDLDRLADNAYVLEVLDKVGLRERFLAIGYNVAATMVELFADLPPEHEFFQQFSFISSDDLPEFQAILSRVSRDTLAQLAAADRRRLMSLPFKLIPARHRIDGIDAEIQAALLRAREVFAADLPADLRDAVAFFDPATYTASANIMDNILLGKIAYGQAQAAEKVGRLIGEVIDALGLREVIIEVGLGFEAGIGGSRLSGAQRQKLAIARAVIKRPDLILLSEATATLDSAAQAAIMERLLEEFADRGLIWSLHRAAHAERFDRILVMKNGRIVEQGSFAELDRDGTEFKRLLSAG